MELKQEEKKKMGIKIVARGGGGLAGIILLGGALGTAALVSAFVIKRKQHSNSNSNSKSTHNQKSNQIDLLNKSKLKDDHELASEGLSFLVPDSSSPLNHHPSNGRADTQNELDSTQITILDETPKNEINGGKDKNSLFSDFPEKRGNYPLCDESCITTEEFSFPVWGSSLSEKVNKKNDSLEEVEAKRVDEEVKVAHSNRVVVDDNREIPSNIEECDGNGEIIVGKIEELVAAARENLREPGEECDDDGHGEIVTVEKCKELVEAGHVESGIQWSREQEVTRDVDQEIISFDSSVTDTNEPETCDVNQAEILLPVLGSSSLSKPGNDYSAEVPLIIESMQVMKRVETIEAVQEDQITVEDRPQAQLMKPEEKEEEPYEVDREITNGKCEEADQIAVEDDDQEMQLSEYQDTTINGDQDKFISGKLSPEKNSFLVYGIKVQELSLLPPNGPLLSESGNLNEDNSAEAALHVEVVKPMEEDETGKEVLYDQITVENNLPMQSSEKSRLENCNYCSENVVAKGEEAAEIVHEDILQEFNNPKTQVREEEDEDDDDDRVRGKNVDEAVETVHVDVVEVDKNLQTQLSEEGDDVDNGGSGKEVIEMVQADVFEVENKLQTLLSEDDGEESDDEEDDEEESDDEEASDDEEDDVGKVEESSETTGDSSLESNAEAIWPAESVQELSLKLKELQANDQNLKETNREDMTANTRHNYQNGYVQSNDHNIKEGEGEGKFVRASTQKFMAGTAALKQPIKFFNLKIWILSLLVLLPLVLWLHVAK